MEIHDHKLRIEGIDDLLQADTVNKNNYEIIQQHIRKHPMKVTITSTEPSLDARLDNRFGRCNWFVIYDLETGTTEFIQNPNKDKVEGAGPAAVQLVAGMGTGKVISGEFGAKVKSIFEQLKIQLISMNDTDKSIGDIIDLLKH